jgi:hypothetical protein
MALALRATKKRPVTLIGDTAFECFEALASFGLRPR